MPAAPAVAGSTLEVGCPPVPAAVEGTIVLIVADPWGCEELIPALPVLEEPATLVALGTTVELTAVVPACGSELVFAGMSPSPHAAASRHTQRPKELASVVRDISRAGWALDAA
jgi:hypothetical protein